MDFIHSKNHEIDFINANGWKPQLHNILIFQKYEIDQVAFKLVLSNFEFNKWNCFKPLIEMIPIPILNP